MVIKKLNKKINKNKMSGCCNQNKKENLKVRVPEVLDEKLLKEYVTNRDNGHLSESSILYYFNTLFGVNYVNTPKNISRSNLNLDGLYYNYNRNNLSFEKKTKKIELNDAYTYELIDHVWTLVEQKKVLIKGMKKTYSDESFSNLLQTDLITSFSFL